MTNEHAATAGPLTDKKKNHKGGNVFPGINVVIGKENLIPNIIKLNASGSEQF